MDADEKQSPRWFAYLELVRLPNVFTAMADVMLGFLFTHESLRHWPVFACLLAASSMMYLAGMVLNDVFDQEIDAVERPSRPIPSGRVSPGTARLLGFKLLLIGVGLGWLAGFFAGQIRPGVVASLLALCVLLYDRTLKRTPVGPLGMGACRFLNVLLGMSAAAGTWHTVHWMVAAGIGVYIVGVTWFARTEASRSNRWQLAGATGVMLCGIGLLAWFPAWRDASLADVSMPSYALQLGERWYLLWLMLGLLIGARCLRAVVYPMPAMVQMAVKNGIMSLIILAAAACFAVRDVYWAAMIVLLLIPTMFLGRWIYST